MQRGVSRFGVALQPPGNLLIGMLEIRLRLVIHLPLDGRALAGRRGDSSLDLRRELVEVLLREEIAMGLKQSRHFRANVFRLCGPFVILPLPGVKVWLGKVTISFVAPTTSVSVP